jgi:hypothetical protein
MYQLNEEQIDLILSDLQQRGIRTEGLRLNLLDHICILIEESLEKEGDFSRCYATVIRSFYKQELKELEDEAQLLMALHKGHILLGRNQFFLLLFFLFLGPFITYDLIWLINWAPLAQWRIPSGIWRNIIFAIYPLLVLLVLFFTPDRLDPLIPKKSKVLLGFKPFIRVLPMNTVQG